MLRTVFLFVLLLVSTSSWGQSEARLLSKSSTGQTALFNLGIHDGIKEGDYAVIIRQVHSYDKRDLRVVPVAKARNVKVNSDSSVWILYHVYGPALLVKGEKFVILTESAMMNGRRNPLVSRSKIVSDKDHVSETVNQALSQDKDRLSKLKNKYREIAPMHDREARSDSDVDLVDVDKWDEAKGVKHRSALFRGPHKDQFKSTYRLESFQSLVTSYLQQVNNPDFNYDVFYAEQMRNKSSNEFKEKTNFTTEYEDFIKVQSAKKTADAKLYRSLLEKGEGWSSDFSDEELRKILNNVSVLQEGDRKVRVMIRPLRYYAALEYAQNLTDQQTSVESGYHRDQQYTITGDFEVVPFLRHETLERFTFNGSVRKNHVAFETLGMNADVNETSASLGANWYPLYAPYAIESAVIFLGAFIRNGFARVSAPDEGEIANYTLFSAPGFRAGMKYNFKNQVSLRIVGSMETLQLERYETNALTSVLPERTPLLEGKLGVGMGYLF